MGRRGQARHAQIHLPPLTADEALLACGILERTVEAIWRAHGEAMADHLAMRGVETPKPPDAVWCGNPDASDDDLDF